MADTSWTRLEALPEQRVVDRKWKSIVYWEIRKGRVYHQGRRLRDAEAATFEVRRDDHDFLARDGSHVYFAWSKLKTVDRTSFEVLTDSYCRDDNLAYWEFETSLKPLKGRDVESFTVLGNGFARDKKYGYFCGKPIRSCTSPMTLVLHPSPNESYPLPFAQDENNVYFEGAALKGADVEEWKQLDHGFSRDHRAVFFAAKKIPRVKIESWSRIEGLYSKDASSVYVMQLRLPSADPATWEPLAGDYSRDSHRVYFVNRVVEGADAETFVVLSGDDELRQEAQDQFGQFVDGVRLETSE